MPWRVMEPNIIATKLSGLVSIDVGSPSIRFEANGAVRRRGYAGKIHMGVMF